MFIAMAVIIIAEQILPHIKSIRANSTIQAVKGGAEGILKIFKKNKSI